MKFINKYKSPNFDKRKKGSKIKYIIIHYTAMRTDIEALNFLCNKKNKVSSHFLINKSGKIYKLVNLQNRAWHAGESYWKGERDINSNSIGIEIDNSGKILDFEKFTEKQILSLIKLAKHLLKRYHLDVSDILGHSDIAPFRKIDPGEKFPWYKLYAQFKGSSAKKIDKEKKILIGIFLKNKKLTTTQKTLFMLDKIGYDVSGAKKNRKNLLFLIKAYQSHYRRSLVNGKIDHVTYKNIIKHYIQTLTT